MVTEAQKLSTKRWREKNREKYNEIQLKYSTKYWNENKEKVLLQKKDYYERSFKKEQRRLFRILLNN